MGFNLGVELIHIPRYYIMLFLGRKYGRKVRENQLSIYSVSPPNFVFKGPVVLPMQRYYRTFQQLLWSLHHGVFAGSRSEVATLVYGHFRLLVFLEPSIVKGYIYFMQIAKKLSFCDSCFYLWPC